MLMAEELAAVLNIHTMDLLDIVKGSFERPFPRLLVAPKTLKMELRDWLPPS